MTTQEILVKNEVFKELGVDINFNLQLSRDCYIHTQRQIEKSMEEYAQIKLEELLEKYQNYTLKELLEIVDKQVCTKK